MNPEQFKRVEELVDGLMQLPAARWGEELGQRCPDDLEVRQEAERLLRGIEELSGSTTPGFFRRLGNEAILTDRATDDMLVGSSIGPYRILEKLGAGGFGSVYKAEQRQPVQRIVALKIIKLGRDTREVIARFNSERQALARMDHPNIAKVLDAGSTDAGKPYFVMEYVGGLPITRFADANKLSIKDRLRLFKQVCEAITHAHQKAVIHRDIKASNVLAFIHDGKPQVKVIDFGIAKALTGDRLTDLTFNTSQGMMIGTYESMSPEQAEGSPDIDTRTDVYSLGVLLYELLTGAPPFDRQMLANATHDEVCRIIRDVEPPKPSAKMSNMGEERLRLAGLSGSEANSLAMELSRELEWIPLKAMRKERDRRYSSPREMAQDIQNYLDHRPLIAGPESRIYRWKKSLRRNSRLVAAIASVMFVLLLGTIGTTIQSIRAKHAERTARDSETRAIDAEKSALRLADDNGRLAREKSAALENANHLLGLAFLEKARRLDADKDNFTSAMTAAFAIDFDEEPSEVAASPAAALLRAHTQDWRDARDLAAMRGTTRLLWRSPAGIHHGGPIRSVAFNHDGTLLASASEDETIRVWDLASGKPRYCFDGYSGEISSVSFSPDGKTLAADLGAKAHIVRFWDIATGKQLPTLLSHPGVIQSVAYSHDGNLVATGSQDGSLRVWNAANGKLIYTMPHAGQIVSISFSPDGKTLATSSSDTTIRLWNLSTGGSSGTLEATGNEVHAVSFSPDGKTIASAMQDCTVCLWDVATKRLFRTFQGHTGPVTSACFSSDGNTLASGSDDKTVRVWDVAAGQPIQTFAGHTDAVTCVSFSPDGKLVASGSRDNRLRLWDLDKAKSLQSFQGLDDAVTSVSFSPDGTTVASASRDNTICLWDAATGKPRPLLRGNPPASARDPRPIVRVVFSPDGKTLATAASNGPVVTLWNLATGQSSQRFDAGESTSSESSVSFSPDGRMVAAGWKGNTICIWDLVTGKPLQLLKGHTDQVAGVCFSPDGKMLASASDDKTVRLWNLATGKSIQTFTDHTREVTCVAFSPDGTMLATGSKDDTIRLWDVASGKSLRPLQGHSLAVSAVNFSPDGQTLASASDDCTLRLWDVATGKALQTLRGSPERVTSVSFNRDGTRLACGCVDSTVSVWEIASDKPRLTLNGHTDRIPSVIFSPDGATLASASYDRTARLWDAKTGESLHELKGHSDQVYCVSFSPNGNMLATGSNDRTVRLWNAKTGTELTKDPLTGPDGAILSVAFSRDGALLAAGSRDPMIHLWDTATGKVAMTLPGHTDAVYCVAFSPDGRLLASGSRDRSVNLWEIPSGKLLRRLTEHTDRVAGLSFSPDGKMLASGSYDKTICIWDVSTGQILQRFEAATGKDSRNWITCVCFSPTDRILASGATDGIVRLWDPVTAQQLQAVRASDAGVFSLSFSPDGNTLATGSNDNSIHLWNVQPDRPLRQYLQVYEFDGLDLKPLPSVNLYGGVGFCAQTLGTLHRQESTVLPTPNQGTEK